MTSWGGRNLDPGRVLALVGALLSVLLVGTLCWLLVAGRPVPTELWITIGGVFGYYLGHVRPAVHR